MFFRRSYSFIIIDETINKSPSKIMFRATVSAATVTDRVSTTTTIYWCYLNTESLNKNSKTKQITTATRKINKHS